MKVLLAAGASFSLRASSRCANRSALDCAALDGHEKVIEAILEHGADVNAASPVGTTALHCAALGIASDQAGAAVVLLDAGAGSGHQS